MRGNLTRDERRQAHTVVACDPSMKGCDLGNNILIGKAISIYY